MTNSHRGYAVAADVFRDNQTHWCLSTLRVKRKRGLGEYQTTAREKKLHEDTYGIAFFPIHFIQSFHMLIDIRCTKQKEAAKIGWCVPKRALGFAWHHIIWASRALSYHDYIQSDAEKVFFEVKFMRNHHGPDKKWRRSGQKFMVMSLCALHFSPLNDVFFPFSCVNFNIITFAK